MQTLDDLVDQLTDYFAIGAIVLCLLGCWAYTVAMARQTRRNRF